MHTDHSESAAVVRQSPLVVALRSNVESSCEIDTSQQGQKPWNTVAERPTTGKDTAA
jgi:hypothetical protein